MVNGERRGHFKWSPVPILRTTAGRGVAFSIDIFSLRETIARSASISVEPHITYKMVARRASTKNNQKIPQRIIEIFHVNL
jgi:hypothetical protein